MALRTQLQEDWDFLGHSWDNKVQLLQGQRVEQAFTPLHLRLLCGLGRRTACCVKALPPSACMVTAVPLRTNARLTSCVKETESISKAGEPEASQRSRILATNLPVTYSPNIELHSGIQIQVDGRIIRYFIPDDVVILNQLGHGANGQVFKCQLRTSTREILPETFAVKLTRIPLSLQRECETLEILNHLVPDSVIPYIGRYHTLKMPVDLSDGTTLSGPRMVLTGIIMQHMPYSDFFDLLNLLQEPLSGDGSRRPLHPWVARWYSIDILNRLYALHTVDYYHGDVKSENIMMKRDGHIVLGDLGETKRDIPENWVTPNLGTPTTQAPELCEGWKGPRRASDIWSVGVILFDMLFGYMPFEGTDPAQVHNNIQEFFRFDSWPTISKRDPFGREKEDALDFLKAILVPSAKRRMWWPEIFAHKWIRDEWSIVTSKCREAPLIRSGDKWIPGRGWAPLL